MRLSLKQIVKSRLSPLVWERLGQAKQEYFWAKQAWHCDENLVPIFKKYFPFEGGYYVDVGANDGRSVSNTYHLEKFQGWSGVLIEPVMHLFFRMRQIRDLNLNSFFNAACVSNEYDEKTVEILYSGLMSISTLPSQKFDANEWAMFGSQFLSRGENVQRTWSQARTLESILIEANSPTRINLLSIDVEGAELDVLEGLIFENWSIDYVLIETEVDSKAHRYLDSKNFELIEKMAQNLLFRDNRFT